MNTHRERIYSQQVNMLKESLGKAEFAASGISADAMDAETILVVGPKSFELGHALSTIENNVISLGNANQMLNWLRNCIKNKMAMPYAILYDIDIPNDNTFTCVEEMKNDPLTKEIPTILISGIHSNEELSRALEVGADDYYSVPVQSEDLIYRIKFLHELNMVIKSSQLVEIEDKKMESFHVRIKLAKRIFDIVFASVLLIALSPFLALIAMLIKLDSKGPVIYVSKRAGREFKVFNFLKFRTMKIDADKELDTLKNKNQYASDKSEDPVFYKIKKDPRITRIGLFLRKTSLDELPQLFNVIRGEMSLVGNRPLPLYEANLLTKDPWVVRFNAPAGMTGLWQVAKSQKENMSYEERIKLDIAYAEHNSFLSDLLIIIKTIPAALQRESR